MSLSQPRCSLEPKNFLRGLCPLNPLLRGSFFIDFYFSRTFFGSTRSFPNLSNMLLLLHIIVTYIKENIITKLQNLYSPSRNPRADKKFQMLFVKTLCTGYLSPTRKIFIKRPDNIQKIIPLLSLNSLT